MGLGQAMTERVVEEARQRGHQVHRLDTLPRMSTAIASSRGPEAHCKRGILNQ